MSPFRNSTICFALLAGCALAALLSTSISCALFEVDGDFRDTFRANQDQSSTNGGNGLPPIPVSKEAVQLEIVFIERPIDDPLLGSSLWEEVDQIGALEPRVRESLRKHGFRIGVASSSPPRPLQKMLGMTDNPQESSGALNSQVLRGRRLVLPAGVGTEIQSSPIYPTCSMLIPDGDDVTVKSYENVRCLFRLKAQRLQEGWAKLEFTPEIHHGEQKLRHTATEAGWQLQTTQKINALYPQRFEITLNLGEMVVITADGRNSKSLGQHFFLGADPETNLQRLLVVRLSDLNSSAPLYAEEL